MIRECPRKENGQDTSVPEKPSEAAWCHFATLAYHLSFKTEEIHGLKLKDLDRERACATLLDARDPEHYRYNKGDFESYQDQMVKMFNSAHKKEQPDVNPLLFVDGPGEDLK